MGGGGSSHVGDLRTGARVLTVMHVLEALGAGCARHVTDLVTHVDGVRHVVVVPPQRPGDETDPQAAERMRAAGAEVHVVDMRRLPVHPRNAAAFVALRRLGAHVGPDVLHGHASIGGALARLAAPPGAAVLWTPNGLMTAAPVVAAERVLRRRTDVAVAVSPSERDLLVRLRIARPEQVVMIRNGIDVAPSADGPDLRALAGVPPHARVVGMVARLAPQKAPLDFVAAARLVAEQLPDIHFVLIGDGRLARDVDAAVAEWDTTDRFHRIPALPGAARVLGQLDVFVLTSRYEGGPYAPLEAMREGTPVVLTDVVGARDTVSDGETGLLVRPGQPGQTAQAILRLLTKQELAAAIVKRSRDWLVEHCDVRRMAADHQALYERLVRRHDRSDSGSGRRARPTSPT